MKSGSRRRGIREGEKISRPEERKTKKERTKTRRNEGERLTENDIRLVDGNPLDLIESQINLLRLSRRRHLPLPT